MHKLCEFLHDELKQLEKKVANGGDLSAAEIEYGDRVAHFEKTLKVLDEMDGGEYSERWEDPRGMSYATRKRDALGRYSRDGELVHKLHELMADAPNEETRHEFKRFISKIEQMG